MKKLLTLIFVTLPFSLLAQGWVGTSNGLHAINSSLGVSPLNVGIGTNAPSSNLQVHGTVRFSQLGNDNLLNKVLVGDADGNLKWRDASTLVGGAGWLTTGNSGTNPATNFLGTLDNQGLRIRTNNISRMTFDAGLTYGSNNFGFVAISDYNNMNANPGQLSIFGKDVPGYSMPLSLNNTRDGQTWSPNAGPNNTLGRHIRFSQFFSNTTGSSQLYDIGISEDSCFFISEHMLSGTGGFYPKKMIAISATDEVGVNMGWNQNPTANFHTVGTVRLENLPSGSGFVLAIDNNGNLYRTNQLTFEREAAKVDALEDKLQQAQNDIEKLKLIINQLQSRLSDNVSQPSLSINPNPSNQSVLINVTSKDFKHLEVRIFDSYGNLLKSYNGLNKESETIAFQKNQLAAGNYFCALYQNGRRLLSEQFIFTN